MISRLLSFLFFVLAAQFSQAVEIVRYVAENGTGEGLTQESPSGDLKKILELSYKVDKLTIYAAPGTYKLPFIIMPDERPKYKNVFIYGGGVTSITQSTEKTIITGDLEIVGGLLVNICFKGDEVSVHYSVAKGTLTTTACNIYYSSANILNYIVTSGSNNNVLNYVNAPTVRIKNDAFGTHTSTFVHVQASTFNFGNGVTIENVRCIFDNCDISYNTRGIYLHNGEAKFNDCIINNNKDEGAVKIDIITNDIAATFNRCIFSENTATKKDCCSVIYGNAPFHLNNCLITRNSCNVKIAPNTFRRGAVEMYNNRSRIDNCTFYENGDEAIYYTSSTNNNTPKDQIRNSVFLKNKSTYASHYTGNSPCMMYCAADNGFEIPEVAAENHNISITEESAKISMENIFNVKLEEGSALINAGFPMAYNDMNNVSRLLYGGTDIGCVEYTGKWEICQPKDVIQANGNNYIKCQSNFNNSNYYAYINEDCLKEEVDLSDAIYLGNNISPLKLFNDKKIAVAYMNIGQEKYAMMYSPANPYGWNLADFKSYKTTLPIAKQAENTWKLIEPSNGNK